MKEVYDINKTLGELEEELSKIKSAASIIDAAKVSTTETISQLKKLSNTSIKLHEGVNNLMEKLDKVDFPSRLNKLDTTVSGLSTSIQNIFGRFDTFETSFNEKLKNTNEEINLKFKKIKNRTNGILILNWIVFLLFALISYKLYF